MTSTENGGSGSFQSCRKTWQKSYPIVTEIFGFWSLTSSSSSSNRLNCHWLRAPCTTVCSHWGRCLTDWSGRAAIAIVIGCSRHLFASDTHSFSASQSFSVSISPCHFSFCLHFLFLFQILNSLRSLILRFALGCLYRCNKPNPANRSLSLSLFLFLQFIFFCSLCALVSA